ncbi:MAG TPA: CheR family methyltransferase, partial [Beijerinckiaceae bacterium]|jgi:chemotaxis protein methyltransferase CheR
MAMTLLALEPKAANYDIRILASDIDPQVVATARAGQYHERDLGGMPAAMRERFMRPARGGAAGLVEVAPEARALISFRELNFNGPWPMRRPFDIVFCRNVVIYFDLETQHRAWSNLARVIEPGGWLYIGHSERLSGPAESGFSAAGTTTYKRR